MSADETYVNVCSTTFENVGKLKYVNVDRDLPSGRNQEHFTFREWLPPCCLRYARYTEVILTVLDGYRTWSVACRGEHRLWAHGDGRRLDQRERRRDRIQRSTYKVLSGRPEGK
jgi:hypothetical protein